MKLYVKKLWSLCPDKYKYITLEKGLIGYKNYLKQEPNKYTTKYKSFEDWLATEI
jgi:hypothetical protein